VRVRERERERERDRETERQRERGVLLPSSGSLAHTHKSLRHTATDGDTTRSRPAGYTTR